MLALPQNLSQKSPSGKNQSSAAAAAACVNAPATTRWNGPTAGVYWIRRCAGTCCNASAPPEPRPNRTRRRNVHGAFVLREGTRPAAHVAILDDVMTTGATFAECTRVLKRVGVKRVDVGAGTGALEAGVRGS
jgi:hypothetical protein